ncbi:PIN domain-containing protein [bacterium]|nr:PIN domain-containing protein [bacterium]
MIAIDTNLLVYAHRSATAEHRAARKAIEAALNTAGGCGITLPSIAEFYSVVTHPAASGRPSSAGAAADFLASLREAGVEELAPGSAFAVRLVRMAADLGVNGARIFDLQIGLCALDGGATELWSHDGGFVKIPGLSLRDPLKAAP